MTSNQKSNSGGEQKKSFSYEKTLKAIYSLLSYVVLISEMFINLISAALGTFSKGFQYTDTPIQKDIVIGRSIILECPSISYTSPKNILWGNVPQSGQPVLLTENRRRYKLSNGNLLFTHVTSNDLKEVNDRLGGISCIIYHNGPYVQSVRYIFKEIASK